MSGIIIVRKSLAFASIFIIISVILSGCVGLQTDASGKDSGKINLFKKKTDSNKTDTASRSNDTSAPSPVSYLEANKGSSYLNWTWENPADKDYSHAIIFIDGKFKKNVSDPLNYYNLTGLKYDTQYRIGIRTVDINKNINPEWVNSSISTLPKTVDKLFPDTIWYLDNTTGSNWINWTWENPADSDYSYANVWIDGMFAANVSKPRNYYLKTGFAPYSTHRISIRTVDKNKNMNPNSVIGNATTTGSEPGDITPPGPITDIQSEADTTWIRWWWTNPDDPDYSYANVYVDGKFAANVTKPTNYYKKTGLLPGTEHNISVRTVDTSRNVYFFSVNDTRYTLP
ncbi:hypothetical protein METP3_00125 [Methanosarcinales archaeon]|nr:hypothetical protein METP3_00125 [Methanosarcinales archaeon]